MKGLALTLTRRLAICGLVTVATVPPVAVHAGVLARSEPSMAMTPAALRFPAGSRVEPLSDHLWLHGLPLQAVMFDAPVDVPELIRTLARQQPGLRDLTVLAGMAILSGRVGGAYWVALLTSPAAGRSVGSVSALQAADRRDAPRPAWLPPPVRLRFDLLSVEAGVRVSERIWQHVLPPARLAPILRQGLQRQGWHDAGQAADAGAWQSWRRRGEQLDWLLTPLDGGSGLWIRRREP